MKKKKYNKKYYTGGRVDMSKGGRIKAKVGGNFTNPPVSIDKKDKPMSIAQEDSTATRTSRDGTKVPVTGFENNVPDTKPNQSTFQKAPVEEKRPDVVQPAKATVRDVEDERDDEPKETGETWWSNAGYNSAQDAINDGWRYNPTTRTWVPGSGTNTDDITAGKTPATPQMDLDTSAAQQRTERIAQTAEQVQAGAEGIVPEAAIIPEAVQVGIDPETGKPIPKQETTVMQEVEGYVDPTARAKTAEAVAPEAVTTGRVTTAQTPEQIQAAQMEAAMVSPDAQVEAAAGEVSDQAIAQAAGVERVEPIEAAEVEIPEGALAERVVGTISEGAKATAAINAGTSLSRITRAKKQLSRAGLSDADIAEIGNDPEALEDRLADFSEEQRGIIEGLPEEALVSTQINGLLEGMENGEIPVWARPAVAQVEQMLARRGMSASTVGRDSLFNAIIQSAMPIAQSNAQAIQKSVSQQKTIEAQTAEANAQRMQQTALSNAQKVFQMDMAQFSADQQTALSNSKFLQTVGLTEANAEQQAVIQDALLMSQANLSEANFYQQTQIQNAKNFLTMDMANLNNQQQANVLKAQQNQQRMLSNQASQNVAAQFNATSENQTQQFMANLNAQMNQYNTSQMNAMEQFNATQANAAEARRANREVDINKFNAQLITQVDQFNSQQDFTRNQWNAQNAAAVEASNVQWRRQANTANTAAQNQINMQNAMNAFGFTSQNLSFLWQELRDQADFDFRGYENEENRKAQIIATAIANEGKPGEKYDDYLNSLLSTIGTSYRQGLG